MSAMNISASVGKGGVNKRVDVKTIQTMLNLVSGLHLSTDGVCGQNTITAITQFQAQKLRQAHPDGRIDKGGQSWAGLNAAYIVGNVAGSVVKPPATTAEQQNLMGRLSSLISQTSAKVVAKGRRPI